jgi:hypothetical protein
MSDEHDFPVKLPATEIAEISNRRASIEMPLGISCAAKTLGVTEARAKVAAAAASMLLLASALE